MSGDLGSRLGLPEGSTQALAELAKATGKTVDAISSAGSYVAQTVGNIPQNVLGVLVVNT